MVLTAGGFLYDVTNSSAGGPRCSEDGQDIGWLRSVDVVATLAQAAPVGLWKDLWKDAVRVEKDGFAWVVKIGLSGEWIWSYSESSKTIADEFADRIRRGLASLPPIRAVLPGGVTRQMFGRDTYVKAFGLVEFVGEGESVDALRAQKVAGIAEALAMSCASSASSSWVHVPNWSWARRMSSRASRLSPMGLRLQPSRLQTQAMLRSPSRSGSSAAPPRASRR